MANNYIFFCYHFQVCELDIIFNFEKAYFILDELLLGGEIQETSKKNVLKAIAAQDLLQEVSDGDTAIELWDMNHFQVWIYSILMIIYDCIFMAKFFFCAFYIFSKWSNNSLKTMK